MGSTLESGAPPSFDDFQRQTSLMTSCTLLWKELTDHFTSIEEDILRKSEAIKRKIETLDHQTKGSLEVLKQREVSIDESVEIALGRAESSREAALASLESDDGEVDNGEGLLMTLKRFCLRMDSIGFWRFVCVRKKELEALRESIPVALGECVDPPMFVLEAISEVFPVDKREDKSERLNDLGWACVLVLESLIPVVVDPVIGKARLLVTPSVKSRASEVAEAWKESLDQRGGIENVKTPDVHTFLQHLVTFGIVKEEDFSLYRKLIIGSAWRKQMPKLAVSLGLSCQVPDMIKELISRRQQLDAVHFAYEVGLVEKFPPAPLLKAYLRDAKKSILTATGDHNSSNRATSGRKEQSALRAVIKCIEEYKLETEFPPDNLKKRLEQIEKAKTEKKKPAGAAVPANKRTRVSTGGGPMPPAKAGRSTNAYVSSSFQTAPTFVRSPSQTQYSNVSPSQSPYTTPSPSHSPYTFSPSHSQYTISTQQSQYTTVSPPYQYDMQAAPGPVMYGNRSPPTPYAYSPEAIAVPHPGPYAPQMVYPPYYGQNVAPVYHQQPYY
uniref:FRIGIDA-like protein n=1 Tax=Kalanchoe fedtschenkoi TaxID=63787 RepID=A0A7N0VKI1_KALFE